MTSDDEKLRLNTLHRFAKHSDELVLVEYSHCEVPAGCGGYVMRWRDPRAGLPLVLSVACPGQLEAFIDAVAVTTSRVSLPVGQHLLAIHATLGKTPAQISVAACVEEPRGRGDEILLTAADGTWRYTPNPPQPASAWLEPSFDASTWKPLGVSVMSEEQLDDADRWRFETLRRRGAEPLRIEHHEIWIRKQVTVRDETL